jgi:hypothetical protein
MNAEAGAAEVDNRKVEVKTEMSMNVIMMISMRIRKIVTWVPVVTNMTGMKTIIIARVEVAVPI